MHPIISPAISIIAGVIILVWPAILNYVIAIYLIVVGILELVNKY